MQVMHDIRPSLINSALGRVFKLGCIGVMANIDLSALLTRNVSNRSVAAADLP